MEVITKAGSMVQGRRNKRKVQKMDESVWSGLPEQLFIPILAQLPLSSLFELRSVCKRWNAILSDPRFLQTCLRAAAEQSASKSRAAAAAATLHSGSTSSSGSLSSVSSPAGENVLMDISSLDRAHRDARRRQHYYCMKFAQASTAASSYRLYISLAKAYYRRCLRDWTSKLKLMLSQR
ncbi:unnamed protein product [Calypogeia fissa]